MSEYSKDRLLENLSECATVIHKTGKPKMSMIPPIIFKCIKDVETSLFNHDNEYTVIKHLLSGSISLNTHTQVEVIEYTITILISMYQDEHNTVVTETLEGLSRVMEFGASKHGAYNYRQSGYNASLYLDAAVRHMVKAIYTNLDDESGLPHILHAITNLGIVYHLINGDGKNDLIPQQLLDK